MREGQARVLSEREFIRAINAAEKNAQAKRNVSLLYCLFGLGLRAKEMASLRIKHVVGLDGSLFDEINLTGSMTKGRKQRHAYSKHFSKERVSTSSCGVKSCSETTI